MKTLYREIRVGRQPLQLELDEGEAKVNFQGRNFDRLSDLVEALPEISDPRFLSAFAVVANFLFSGMRYETIEEITRFCSIYKRRLEGNSDIKKYGVFDLTAMKAPYIEEGQAIIYVEELSTGLPYKLLVPYPYHDPLYPFEYTLLPYQG